MKFVSQGFTCTSCGKCCTSRFEIPVEPDKAAQIKQTAVYQRCSKEGFEPLPVLAGNHTFLGYNEAGQCLFYDDGLCCLHKEQGGQAKPLICQVYPYNFVNTPNGMTVSLLFSCPSVVAGNPDNGEEAKNEISTLLEQERLPVLSQIKNHILVTSWETMEWQSYLRWESRFLEEWNGSSPLQGLLEATASLIESNGTQPASADLLEKTTEAISQFAVSCLVYLEQDVDDESFFSALHNDEKPASHRLEAPLPQFSLLTPHSQIEREALTRYVRNQVEGRLLLIGPSLVCRLLLCTTALSILLYDLNVMRERDGTRHFDFHHLQQAFATCEERLVSQSNDLEPYLLEMEEYLFGSVSY